MTAFINTIFSLIVLCLTTVFTKDLYQILEVSRTATSAEIKQAYRRKARDTHPDKQIGIDPEISAQQFREVVEAYEVLSDKNSRQNYDRTGDAKRSRSQSSNTNSFGNNQGWSNFGFNFNFQSGRSGGQRSSMHWFLFDPLRRRQIEDARSRVVTVRSLFQFRDIISSENGDVDITERYTLIAFYDSSKPECSNILDNFVLYPWPFAGFSNEGNSDGDMWWEEIMLAVKIDMHEISQRFTAQLAELFTNIQEISQSACPSFAFLPRGIPAYLDPKKEDRTIYETKNFKDTDPFRAWVWAQLQMKITIVNKTPWVLKQWFLDGYRGVKKEDVLVDHEIVIKTFLSHIFIFRPAHVEGNRLTNEVGNFCFLVSIVLNHLFHSFLCAYFTAEFIAMVYSKDT